MEFMNKTREAAMMLSSLSVYKGIKNRTVPRAYYDLLCALDEPVQSFLEKWGRFFELLCRRGYSDSLARCLSKAALFDENAFSRAAAAGETDRLTEWTEAAVRRDISAINKAGKITAEDIIKDYRFREDLGSVADTLPRWGTGDPVEEFSDENTAFEKLSDYYRYNGCGMFARYRAFIWRNKNIEPVVFPDSINIQSLKGYELQRGIVVDNTTAFLEGVQCNNCLLYGDMGTGKSSTVKAILNKYYTSGLRMVEIPKDKLSEFPLLAEKIADIPLKFIIFIDDLSFGDDDRSYAQLKAVLEGGLAVRPENTLIYATSNRRHLIKENFSDRAGDDIHRNDTMQETLSLSDRFGLTVNFSKPGKQEYIDIVQSLAKENGIEYDQELIREAEQWALARSGRSPRCAKQYISSVLARKKNEEENTNE